MPYIVTLVRSAQRALTRLPAAVQTRVVGRIDSLAEEPRPPGAINVVGASNTYRIRVGDYRVIYEVQDTVLVVLVIRVGHRGDVYRGR